MFVFVINRNRLTLTKNLVDWCAEHDLHPIIVDNASDYPPLLDYYDHCPHPVIKLPKNFGHTVMWDSHILDMYIKRNDQYIVTDPDLDLTGVCCDFLEVMQVGLRKYPNFDKCGLSLEIKDLPDTVSGKAYKEIERKYWEKPLDEVYFEAPTDTTFALYNIGVRHYSHSAIRTNRPYTARHIPWYYERLRDLPEDEQYYFRTANASSSGKKRLIR